MSDDRSRYLCKRCTLETRSLVVSDSPICDRCTGVCVAQRITNAAAKAQAATGPVKNAKTEVSRGTLGKFLNEDLSLAMRDDATLATQILARAHARGYFAGAGKRRMPHENDGESQTDPAA